MKQLLLHVTQAEKVLAVLEDGRLSDISVEKAEESDLVGRIYKGIIKNVVPSINGMFVDIGIGRNAFLRCKDIISSTLHTEGASVLVQVEKDSTETKGPLVTEKISLAGKYIVALLNTGYIGVSKKIRSEEKRKNLRETAHSLCPPHMGAIVRTSAENVDVQAFAKDVKSLADMAEILYRRYKVEKAPVLLYRDSDLAVKCLRDYDSSTVESIWTDNAEVYHRLHQMGRDVLSEIQVHHYTEHTPLFSKFHVDKEMQALFARVVPLSSGGSIVIDYTEALTAIDVNSGSFKGNMPHNELAYLINQSAVKEIARQIRLRGIGGIIMIDFIDMEKKSQQMQLVQLLKDEVRKDRVKTVVCGMTSLGLVEMTRKRTVHRLWQNYYEICPWCHGEGRILSVSAVAGKIFSELEKIQARGPIKSDLLIRCEKEVASFLRKQENQDRLRQMMHKEVTIEALSDVNREMYSILAN